MMMMIALADFIGSINSLKFFRYHTWARYFNRLTSKSTNNSRAETQLPLTECYWFARDDS